MASPSLLMLLDDISVVLDDVAVLSKVAAKKTAGVLGDDLALNAEQVSGVKADRELPVVWAVAKGSFLNKLILVPSALLISAVYSPLITILLVLGGLFLCFEGAEKVIEKFFHSKVSQSDRIKQLLEASSDGQPDLVQLEKAKIKGAIRTDFILSAEIIVIILGSVQEANFSTQVMVVSSLAVLFTIGVYGFVAAIVKLDDLGLYLLRKSVSGSFNTIQRSVGRGLLILAPNLMKFLTIIGTIAMFLVGGGIIVHSFPVLHNKLHHLLDWFALYIGDIAHSLGAILTEGFVGIAAGLIVVLILGASKKIKK